jgi:hypothetical protein
MSTAVFQEDCIFTNSPTTSLISTQTLEEAGMGLTWSFRFQAHLMLTHVIGGVHRVLDIACQVPLSSQSHDRETESDNQQKYRRLPLLDTSDKIQTSTSTQENTNNKRHEQKIHEIYKPHKTYGKCPSPSSYQTHVRHHVPFIVLAKLFFVCLRKIPSTYVQNVKHSIPRTETYIIIPT